jgi:hypothetical protein
MEGLSLSESIQTGSCGWNLSDENSEAHSQRSKADKGEEAVIEMAR